MTDAFREHHASIAVLMLALSARRGCDLKVFDADVFAKHYTVTKVRACQLSRRCSAAPLLGFPRQDA
eukprot:7241217-Lingulodinium_polyedra.AAC.1